MTKESLDDLWGKFRNNELEEVVNEVKELIEDDNLSNRSEALKLLGLSYFRLGKYDLAEQVFIEQTKDSKNSDDWFNLITSSTLNKNFELSDKAYQKAVEFYHKNGTEENIPIPQMCYYYMQGLRDAKEYQRAFIQLETLKKFYCTLVITDDTFLHMRGIPFLSHTMRASKEILENTDKEKVRKFIDEFKNKIDDDGKEYLSEFEETINYSS